MNVHEQVKSDNRGGCGSAALIRGALLLQEKWLLLIVHQLMNGPVGFCELNRKAKGVNPTTLSQRLDMLEEAGLVTKTVQSYMPPRTSYELTEAGLALRPVLQAIERWSERYLPESQSPGCPTGQEHESPPCEELDEPATVSNRR